MHAPMGLARCTCRRIWAHADAIRVLEHPCATSVKTTHAGPVRNLKHHKGREAILRVKMVGSPRVKVVHAQLQPRAIRRLYGSKIF